MWLNRISVIFLALAHFCALSGSTQYGKYYAELNGSLRVHTEPADWLTARIQCHLEGAFLTSPWSGEFTNAIRDIQKGLQESGWPAPLKIYSGVHATFAEGALTFIEGKPVMSLSPKNLADLDRCEVFLPTGFIEEVNCTQKLPYVCYKPGSEPVEPEVKPESTTEHEPEDRNDTALCGDESLGYEFAEQTGHCYKFHPTAVLTWNDAKYACEEEGAHLAIVNSDEEAQVLIKLFAKYPPEKIFKTPFPDTAAVGYIVPDIVPTVPFPMGHVESERILSAMWRTIEGETLQQAGYDKWRPEAPHPFATIGTICRDGLLYGYTSDNRQMPFICEKKAFVPDDLESRPKPEIESESETEAESTTEQAEPLTSNHNCGDQSLGYEFAEQTGYCYKLHVTAVFKWYDAKHACEIEGADLVSIESIEEADIVINLIGKYSHEDISGTNIIPFVCKKNLSEPDDLESTLKPETEYEAETETQTEPEIIYELTSALVPTPTSEELTATPKCGEESLGYEFAKQTGYCYKFHAMTGISWDDAEHICQIEGALKVADIESYKELQVVQNMFDHYISYGGTTDPNIIRFFCKKKPSEPDNLESTLKPETEYEPETETQTEPEIVYELTPASLPAPILEGLTVTPKCGEESLGYKFAKQTGYCYKLHAIKGISSHDSERICQIEGALIVDTSESHKELMVIANMFDYYLFYEKTGTFIYPFFCKKKPSEPDDLESTLKPETEYEAETETQTEPEIIYELTSALVPTPIPVELTATPKCGEESLGYEFAEQTRHCYKFHPQAVHTWYDAKYACESEGAYLAIVNSDKEAQVLSELFNRYSADMIHGTQEGYTDTAAIGNLYNEDTHSWQTINGESLEEAGYAEWSAGFPHPWARLGFIFRNGTLYGYVPAIRDVPFICEMPPVMKEKVPNNEIDEFILMSSQQLRGDPIPEAVSEPERTTKIEPRAEIGSTESQTPTGEDKSLGYEFFVDN